MTTPVCPYLGLLDDPEAHLNYASFENRCYATVARESIQLSEQSVFCLGGQCNSCPRYMAVHGPPQPEPTIETAPLPAAYPPPATAQVQPLVQQPPTYVAIATPVQPASGRDWSMAVILGGMLVGILLCVGAFAGYFSLRALVTTALPQTTTPVAVVVVSLTPTPTLAGVIVVIPGPSNTPTLTSDAIPTVLPTVTPMPGVPTDTPIVIAPTPGSALTPTLVPTPTKRATPTSRPKPTSTRRVTATPRITPSRTFTPVKVDIRFTASKTTIVEGACSIIRWNVQNAKEVYYEGKPVAGVGSSEECPIKTTTYTLTVVDLRGRTTKKTLTLSVIKGSPSPTASPSATWTPWPTATPSPTLTTTPSKTPTPTATLTPTVTPTSTVLPTATATKFFIHWSASPSSSNGTDPEVTITFTNSSSLSDSLALSFHDVELPDGWGVEMCINGDCGSSKTTPDLQSGASVGVTVKFSVPGAATSGESGSVNLHGRSFLDPSYTISVPITVEQP
ncbi:MAG: hypothetical protein GY759_05865 [Chloroflexi bacterium]|nr:hypothetical protein [Chloroflexota bacterium]